MADARGDQCGLEQHSGVQSSAVSAVAWSLPQLYLESDILHPSRSLDKYLGTHDSKWGLFPRSLSIGGLDLQTQLFLLCVQIS